MRHDRELSVGEALHQFREAHALGLGYADAATWSCRIGPLTLTLPNFKWRRRAIVRHDLHHVLTGYPCTMGGEFQMAAWEFAGGRFPHPAATLFCLPLVAAGVWWSPGAMWRAFLNGRRSRTLYGRELTPEFLGKRLQAVQQELAADVESTPPDSDVKAFLILLLQAHLLVLTPIVGTVVLLARVW